MAGAEKGLEEVVVEIGNRLLAPPSAVDELLSLLDQAETLLSRVEQSPSRSMSAALHPAMEGLSSKELLGHADVDVKVAVASCISEITRITAPEAPYDDDLMKEIFEMIVESFEKLDDMQNRSYKKRVSILETVAKVRSCVVMLDLECDALILEMFHYFLTTIRDSHPRNVLSSMEMIMTVVLEESEDISPDLLSCLLASVKKDNKDISQIAQKLAEKVIANCALKLKPCLEEAVHSLGSSLDDFSDIVSLVCQSDSDQLLYGALNTSAKCLADDSKLSVRTISDELPKSAEKQEPEVVCSEEINNAVGKSPKSVKINGTMQTENGDSSFERALPPEKIEDSSYSIHARDMMTSVVETDKVDTRLGANTTEPGHNKNDSVTQTVEATGVSLIDGNKESVDRSEGSNKEIDSSQAEGAAYKKTEATALKTDAKTSGLQPLSEKSAKDDASTVSSMPSENTPEIVRRKRGRPPSSKNSSKKGRGNKGLPVSPSENMVKDHTKNEETPSTDINSQKQNEGISDFEPNALGQSVKKGPVRNVVNGEDPSTESQSKVDLDITSDSEGKHLGGMKPQEKAKEGEISGTCQTSKDKQQTGEPSSEDNGAKDSNLKEKASSVKTDAKAAHDENHVAKTPIMRSQKKHPQEKEALESPHGALKYDESLIGAEIKVWWPDDNQFYAGIVDSYDPDSMRHKVLYADGDEEDLILKDETFEFIKGVEEVEEHDRTLGSGMSRKRANTSASKKLKEVASSKGGRRSSTGKQGKSIGSGGKSIGSLRGRRSKRDDSTPTGSEAKEKVGNNRSRVGSRKAGPKPKDEASKELPYASPETTMKAHGETPKGGSASGEGAANKSTKDGKSAAGLTSKDGSTPRNGKSDANGSAKGKTGPSKRHRDQEALPAGTAKESEERSGKKRRR